ncbi:MAG: ATP-binding cassette domain-containing protein, partial [Pseudomonadota bacterium]
MGRAFDQANFDWAIEQAAMQRDLRILPHGADTIVGERGTTLSGGQQARVSIARALYGKPDLLIADDPLAAVDAVVAATVFANFKAYVAEAPARRAAVLALNQLQLLPQCDTVAYLQDGVLVGHAPYAELHQQIPAFGQYASSYQKAGESSIEGEEEAAEA